MPKENEPNKEELKKPTEMSQEELEAASNAFLQRQFPGYRPPVKKEPPPDEAEEEKKKQEEEAAKKAEEEEAAKKTEEEEAAKKAEEEEAAKKAAESQKPVPPPISEFKTSGDELPKKQDQPDESGKLELSKREKLDLSILEKMAALDPRHRELPDQYRNYLTNARSYVAKWKQENPTRKFNAKDEEHQEFFEQHYPDIDDDDFKLAEHELIREEAVRESKAQTQKELDRMQRKSTIEKREPEIGRVAESSVMALLENSDEVFSKHMKEDKKSGAKVIDEESLKAIREEDAGALDAVLEEAEPLRIMVAELEKVAADPDEYKLDPTKRVRLKETDQNFYPHAELDNFLAQWEEIMLKLPPEKTAVDGKRLVSSADFSDEVEKINKMKVSNEEKKKLIVRLSSSYYTLTVDHYRAGLVAYYTNRAKKKIERVRKYTGKTQSNGKKDEGEGKKVEDKKAASTTGSRKSPDLASKSDATDLRKDIGSEKEKILDNVVNRAFGRG